MRTTYWVLWTVMTLLALVLFWPLGILIGIVSLIVVPIAESHNTGRLKAKIDLIAKQLGIQYGTPEEKLDQLAILAAKGQKAESGANP